LKLQKVGIGAEGAKKLAQDIQQSVKKTTGGRGVEVDVAVSSSSLHVLHLVVPLAPTVSTVVLLPGAASCCCGIDFVDLPKLNKSCNFCFFIIKSIGEHCS
jgi:hypothetical protein